MIKIALPFKIRNSVLAFGSHTKNTLCFLSGKTAILSDTHADLSSPGDFDNFRRQAEYFLRRHPRRIAYDLHPDYQSSKFAARLSLPAGRGYPVQHHHAHIASCMAENNLKNQKVIGIAFDGTGLGSDATIWGGEFLVCDYKNYRRAGYLQQAPLAGGERAVLEPWRMAAFWLELAFQKNPAGLGIGFSKKFPRRKWQAIKDISAAGINSPQASSMGRLFDAAASLILGKYSVTKEAELAIELEKSAWLAAGPSGCLRPADFSFLCLGRVFVASPLPVFRQITGALRRGCPKEEAALAFHDSVARLILRAAVFLRAQTGIKKVALSGGVFQNNLLLKIALDLLYKHDFRVFTQQKLSCNDAGISLGQAVIAGLINGD